MYINNTENSEKHVPENKNVILIRWDEAKWRCNDIGNKGDSSQTRLEPIQSISD